MVASHHLVAEQCSEVRPEPSQDTFRDAISERRSSRAKDQIPDNEDALEVRQALDFILSLRDNGMVSVTMLIRLKNGTEVSICSRSVKEATP